MLLLLLLFFGFSTSLLVFMFNITESMAGNKVGWDKEYGSHFRPWFLIPISILALFFGRDPPPIYV